MLKDNCKQNQTCTTTTDDHRFSVDKLQSTTATVTCTSTSTSLRHPFTPLDDILSNPKYICDILPTSELKSSTSTSAGVTATSNNPFDYKAPLDITTKDALNALFPCSLSWPTQQPSRQFTATLDNPLDYKAPLDITTEDVLNTLSLAHSPSLYNNQ